MPGLLTVLLTQSNHFHVSLSILDNRAGVLICTLLLQVYIVLRLPTDIILWQLCVCNL